MPQSKPPTSPPRLTDSTVAVVEPDFTGIHPIACSQHWWAVESEAEAEEPMEKFCSHTLRRDAQPSLESRSAVSSESRTTCHLPKLNESLRLCSAFIGPLAMPGAFSNWNMTLPSDGLPLTLSAGRLISMGPNIEPLSVAQGQT